ncbi:MAG: hypothetical protein ACI4T4_05455, partial [Limosilactobacillus sp.]
MSINLTDRQRVQLAQREYWDWQVGQRVYLPGKVVIGQVERVVNTTDGFRATVIRHSLTEKVILLRGSSGIRRGDPTTWTNEWLRVNLPVGDAILHRQPAIPAEMWTAANWLNQQLAASPTASFYLYGHSLGSING